MPVIMVVSFLWVDVWMNNFMASYFGIISTKKKNSNNNKNLEYKAKCVRSFLGLFNFFVTLS